MILVIGRIGGNRTLQKLMTCKHLHTHEGSPTVKEILGFYTLLTELESWNPTYASCGVRAPNILYL